MVSVPPHTPTLIVHKPTYFVTLVVAPDVEEVCLHTHTHTHKQTHIHTYT